MKKPKTFLAWAFGILAATAFTFQVHGQQERPHPLAGAERPTEEEVNAILEQWREDTREAAKSFMERHGRPHEATLQRLIWHQGEWWTRTEIVNEAVRHNFPEEHTDFIYQTVQYNVPVERVGELAQLSGSLIVDRVKGELTARADSERHALLLLNVADQVIDGRHTGQSGRDVIAQAWLEGEHEDMMERLLFSPEVAHPEAGDPGVVYGARPEEDEQSEEPEAREEEEDLPILRRR